MISQNLRHLVLGILLLLGVVGSFAQVSEVGQHHRVALVIGNSTYLTGPLRNTVNDARAMALALESAGFEVILKENITNQNEMKKAVREFGLRLKTDGTALFYYSGHGMQMEGFNYLIPTQAVLNIQQEVEYEALDVGLVLAYMESAKSEVNIVILDACRNNPFARTFRDTKQGLSSMVAPTGTLVAYSTSPGSVASDGNEDYGLYTKSLLGHMQRPGLKVEDVFKSVRAEVLDKSQGNQTPWESSSLLGDFYFHPPGQDVPRVIFGFNRPEMQSGNGSVIPDQAIKKEGTRIRFKWRASADGTYLLQVDDRELSSETVNELRGEHLYVYHPSSNRVFILKSFIYRMDGFWRHGTSFD